MDSLDLNWPVIATLASILTPVIIMLLRHTKHGNNLHDIALAQKCMAKRMNDYNYDGDCGLLPTEKEEKMETGLLSTDMDRMLFYGNDQAGNTALLSIVQRSNRHALVWVYVHTYDGYTYQLPNHPDTNVYNTNESEWDASGLHFEVLEPMRKWRICFKGYLQDQTGSVTEGRFNFIWTALQVPFDIKKDSHPHLLGTCLPGSQPAHEKWNMLWYAHAGKCELDGYEQWGSFIGEIEVAEKCNELYLRGLRLRQWSTCNVTCMDTHVTCNTKPKLEFIGCTKDGFYVHLVVGEKQKYGHITTSQRQVYALDKLELSLEMARDGMPPGTTVTLSAKETSHLMTVGEVNHSAILYEERPWQVREKLQFLSFTLNSKHSGYGIIIHKSRWDGPCPFPPEVPFPSAHPKLSKCQKSFVISFGSLDCQSTILVGGKGASLALLVTLQEKLGFSVTDGICVTTEAFKRHKERHPEINDALVHVANVAAGAVNGDLQEACDRAMNVIKSTSIEGTDICEALIKQLNIQFGDIARKKLAVRSSAVGEDSEELSSAGQNETFLGIMGVTSIMSSVIKCWASPYSFRSVTYRRQYGQEVICDMGVVIQEMVEAEAAGVMFTADPVTGSTSSVTITANYGLGESVVSASADPDSVVIRRKWDGNLDIISKYTGAKSMKVVTGENGSQEVMVDSAEAQKMCITDETAIKLAQIGIQVEKMCGSPRDIEWAVTKESIYLLQVRPIATLYQWSNYELSHEMDTSVLTDDDCFTKANTGEVLPNSTTPLSLSTVVKTLDASFQLHLLKESGLPFLPHGTSMVGVSQMHVFLNVVDVFFRLNSTADFNDSMKALNVAVFGHLVFPDKLIKTGVDRYGLLTRGQQFAQLKKTLRLFKHCRKDLETTKNKYKGFQICLDRTDNPLQMLEEIERILPVMAKVCEIHSTISRASSSSQIFLFMMVCGGKGWDADVLATVARLLSSCVDVVSVQIPRAMKEIAKTIHTEGDSNHFLSLNSDEANDWLRSNGRKSGQLYLKFIDEFGHHGPKEFDMGVKSWNMDPKEPVGILQSMLKNPDSLEERDVASHEDFAKTLLASMPWLKRLLCRHLLSFSLAAVGYREQSKTLLVRMVDQFRQSYSILGSTLVRQGQLPDAELIHFFTHYELKQLLRTRSAGLIRKAVSRRRLYPEWESLRFPELCFGHPSPAVPEASSVGINPGVRLVATPASVGFAKGTARVVTNLSDAHTIQKGDILVTYGTNVGWTPYFALLSGVITELGGTISHGTVVARDHGIPCIVGADNATLVFKSGDVIQMDGAKGYVEKVE